MIKEFGENNEPKREITHMESCALERVIRDTNSGGNETIIKLMMIKVIKIITIITNNKQILGHQAQQHAQCTS